MRAVERAFRHTWVDYAMLQKLYGSDPAAEKRYSPAVCIGVKAEDVFGNPDPAKISTSYVERQNLTMRMGMRRFTRLTNAFSKKVENLAHAVSLHYMHYNFARPHKTLADPYPRTPAMAAGVADHVWTLQRSPRCSMQTDPLPPVWRFSQRNAAQAWMRAPAWSEASAAASGPAPMPAHPGFPAARLAIPGAGRR